MAGTLELNSITIIDVHWSKIDSTVVLGTKNLVSEREGVVIFSIMRELTSIYIVSQESLSPCRTRCSHNWSLSKQETHNANPCRSGSTSSCKTKSLG